MFKKVLIANRGEIAARIGRTLRRMGIASVAVHSEADRFTPPVLAADEAVAIGASAAAESYLRIEAIVDACRATGAEAVHPGYGFLSERPAFAEALETAGIRFIGPSADTIRAFGLKHTARELAVASDVALLPGSPVLADAAAAREAADTIGFPVILKSTAGGGGIGMQVCRDAVELVEKFTIVQRMARANFGDERVYLEKYVAQARHVEVQIFGDGEGRVVSLGDRDCSLQRRHQKVIEETPAPGLSDRVRLALHEAARALCRRARYASAGTVEFLYDAHAEAFYFLEVNTRLQVEHCVTEDVFDVDLVEWMVRHAAGEFDLPPQDRLMSRGHAIEARVYAENAAENFRPSTGLLTEVRWAPNVRVETWIETGVEVTPHYDPLLAKLIGRGNTRAEAVANLRRAVTESAIWGVETNLDYLATILDVPAFGDAKMTTATLAAVAFAPRAVAVLSPGTQSSVQELPGRLGAWAVGVPPSGPMDPWSHRRANALVRNPPEMAALEMTLAGPTLRFDTDALVAICGAVMVATVDGAVVPHDTAFGVRRGEILTIGAIEGRGMRATLAVRGGIAAPVFMGSRATFALGGFGGHATGVLRVGDVLRLDDQPPVESPPLPPAPLTGAWDLLVLYGPHGAPDFFHPDDIADLFGREYEVHYNSARTGIRLIGPKPRWARRDGGEAGLHPSNIHDNAYAIGAVDFTGDMPIILGPDGPSLGGFVCPAVVASEDLWKLGHLRPGDTVRFRRLATPSLGPPDSASQPAGDPVLLRIDGETSVVVRRAGDANILIEYGPLMLDIRLRLRVQLLHDALKDEALPGVIDLTPGIRSLQVHYDPAALSLQYLLDAVTRIEAGLSSTADVKIPSRIVHLPLSWDDPQTRLAMLRYQDLVRADAPWCPSNIEFIRRINGLASEDDVRAIVFDASYLVMGLGDVYLGAPVATPLDPRHRLVTTKYNPARPWTPQNAVGIGGAYMCIYGMEGPGGYQLFGRTIQVWNSWRRTTAFTKRPLLRFFDQIRFFPVSEEELLDARAAFPHGRYDIRIEETAFETVAYDTFLARHAAEIAVARACQQAAFEAERQDWTARGLDRFEPAETADVATDDIPTGCAALASPVPGIVWKVLVTVGERVFPGQAVAIIESMKTEISVVAGAAGRIQRWLCAPGREVKGGETLGILRIE